MSADQDMLDAMRYRWLAAQFELQSESHERQELVAERGNRKTYEALKEYWHVYQLRDDWRFVEHTDREKATSFDALIDRLRKEFPHQPDGAQ